MWLLSCSGDLFGGKRKWCAPGSINLLGRTTSKSDGPEHINYIDHKSVSRKHLIIEVGNVTAGDVSKLHKRTEVTVTDKSKVGSTVDGEKFCKEAKKLEGKSHTFKLGSYEHTFKLEWVPVSLTCLWLSKKGGDALAEARRKLEGTDIKLVLEYVSNETTHVLAKRRNAAQSLQALIQGKWLITPDWLDQLAQATQRHVTPPNGEWKGGPLEVDFDGNWPTEDEYITPPATEPHPRPAHLLKPNPERADVFQDFIFVFLTQDQHDTLLPVITTGGGKAMLWEWEPGKEVSDLVSYVSKLAGKKDGSSQLHLSQWSGKGGIVCVRFGGTAGEEEKEFMEQMDLALKQRSINQNEFLDPIITCNTSELRQPLLDREDDEHVPPVDEVQQQPSPPRSQPREDEQMEDVQEPPAVDGDRRHSAPRVEASREDQAVEEIPDDEPVQEPVAKKPEWNRRNLTKSRWQGFDDFDTSQFSKIVAASPSPEPELEASASAMDVDGEPSQAGTQAHKRPATIVEDEEEDVLESMLHGQAALKRRKTEAAKRGEKSSFAKSLNEEDAAVKAEAEKDRKRKTKSEKLPDVKAALQARKEEAEEKRKMEEEALREQLDGIDLSEIRNLVKVEEIDLPARDGAARPARTANREDRWDPAWNGRKNFKKFRPQGQRQDGPRLPRVIVRLEEVPRKGHGIGDEYWLTRTNYRNKSKSQSKSQSQSQTVRAGPEDDDDDEDRAVFRRRLQRSREEDEEDTTDQIDPDEIAGGAQASRANGWAALAKQSQTFATESQRKGAGKRPAAQQAGGPAKKAKQTQLQSSRGSRRQMDDDDDDDELMFKRRR